MVTVLRHLSMNTVNIAQVGPWTWGVGKSAVTRLENRVLSPAPGCYRDEDLLLRNL